MKTFRIGIIGAGMIAAVHADAIRALTGAELAGVMDRLITGSATKMLSRE